MGKPKAPAPPDPKETSAAQTGTNISTAIANSALNSVNQVTPDGSLTYSTSGYSTITDPYTGQTYQVPNRTATQTLSPQQQAIKDQNDAASLNLGTLAKEQSAKLQNYLNEPVNLDNDAIEGRLMELGMKRLQPQLDQRRQAAETDLINRGIRPGSTNYNSAQDNLMQGENDAFNQLLLSGRGQSIQEILASRNQPINEITALMSGSQVSQPNFINPYTTTIPTTDNAGLINQNYAQQQQNYQQQMAQRSAMLGGLFGVGAAFAGR